MYWNVITIDYKNFYSIVLKESITRVITNYSFYCCYTTVVPDIQNVVELIIIKEKIHFGIEKSNNLGNRYKNNHFVKKKSLHLNVSLFEENTSNIVTDINFLISIINFMGSNFHDLVICDLLAGVIFVNSWICLQDWKYTLIYLRYTNFCE